MKTKLTIASTLALLGNGAITAQSKPLNIIHILVDDVGYDDLSCFGSKDIKTPNLDKLASEGVRFTNFMAPHATSTPTRAALLTGRYAGRMNNAKGLEVLFPNSKDGLDPDQEICLAKLLKQQGYTTGLVGKWHLGCIPPYTPTYHGFDRFIGTVYPNDHAPERLAGTGSRGYDKVPLYDQDQLVKRCENYELAELPALFVRETCTFMRNSVEAKKPFYLQWSNIETHTPWFIPMGFEGRSKAGAFGDAVEYMDLSVGIVLDYIKKLGIEENTLIVFSSDNGPLIGYDPELYACYGKYGYVNPDRTHVLREGKYQNRFEGGPRVACIMRLPGVTKPGTTCDTRIAGFDLFTTFLELAGGSVPTDRVIDGKNIMPIISKDSKATTSHEVFYGMNGKGNIQSVTQGNWKLCLADGKRFKEDMLFDLSNDLSEQNDISKANPDKVKALRKLSVDAKTALKEHKPMPVK